jgi:NAD(P)-dependent dehydrogenase (short-subunit alcohol dehydrogenase family)
MGAACARLLALLGATVVVACSKSADRADAVVAEIAAAGCRAFAVKADAGDADAAKAGVAQAVDRIGGRSE